jgi:diaminopimelate epimerase
MRLTKHHGLGNDFLVVIDLERAHPIDADLARRLCHRRLGIGADGLIHVGAGGDGADVTMTLLNADGSRAEMSGNGIRCLGQAARMAGLVLGNQLLVATDAGLRTLRFVGEERFVGDEISVDMGAARPLDGDGATGADNGAAAGFDLADATPLKAMGVDMGNPHRVLLFDTRTALDAAADHLAAAAHPSENVELIAVAPDGGIEMRVVERGVGETQACGTGACAAAFAAHQWGLVEPEVSVTMPGGPARVTLGDTITLTGPAVHIADVEVPDTPWR